MLLKKVLHKSNVLYDGDLRNASSMIFKVNMNTIPKLIIKNEKILNHTTTKSRVKAGVISLYIKQLQRMSQCTN